MTEFLVRCAVHIGTRATRNPFLWLWWRILWCWHRICGVEVHLSRLGVVDISGEGDIVFSEAKDRIEAVKPSADDFKRVAEAINSSSAWNKYLDKDLPKTRRENED